MFRIRAWRRPQPSAFVLPPSVPHIWLLDLTQEPDLLEHSLSSDERIRAGRITLSAARKRFVLARGAMRGILGRYLHCAPGDIEFRYGALGKPEVAQPVSELGFNLSHSADMGLLAVAAGESLGIDLEPIRIRANARGIIRKVFDASTATELLALPDDRLTPVFLRQWTRHEARVKALGKGLFGHSREPIDVISFEPLQGWVAALAVKGPALPSDRWQAFDFRVEDFRD